MDDRRKRKSRRLIFRACMLAVLLTAVMLCFFGVICPNDLFASKYAVKGIDVSHYQGNIDWDKVKRDDKNIAFAYIKATEGSTNQDEYFAQNREGAREAGILTGAYHYFTLTSTGGQQAANFIQTVPKAEVDLPPMVDLEDEGASREQYQKELQTLLDTLESYYGKKPVLYVVYPVYDEYIRGSFADYPIWVRSIFLPPDLGDHREWLLWQYCDRGRVDGIDGYVDINVFQGSMEELEGMAGN
jgi:lysozyme